MTLYMVHWKGMNRLSYDCHSWKLKQTQNNKKTAVSLDATWCQKSVPKHSNVKMPNLTALKSMFTALVNFLILSFAFLDNWLRGMALLITRCPLKSVRPHPLLWFIKLDLFTVCVLFNPFGAFVLDFLTVARDTDHGVTVAQEEKQVVY